MTKALSALVAAGAVAVWQSSVFGVCSRSPADTSKADLWIFQNQGGTCPGNAGFGYDCSAADPRISIWFAPQWCVRYSTCPTGFPAFNNGMNEAWHFDLNEWGNSGQFDDYDPNSPYSKMLNSAYIVYFGLEDNDAQSWHGTQDYIDLSGAGDTVYHSAFFRSVVDDSKLNGKWSRSFPFGDDELSVSCLMLDTSRSTFANPSSRLANVMHESWHAWENKNFHAGSVPHRTQQGNCSIGTADNPACDYYYPHTLNTFRPFGTLYQASFNQAINWLPAVYTQNSADPNKFHSPSQIAMEFMCDLANNHAPWVTMDIVTDAQARAREIVTKRFINMPPMDCGSGRPL